MAVVNEMIDQARDVERLARRCLHEYGETYSALRWLARLGRAPDWQVMMEELELQDQVRAEVAARAGSGAPQQSPVESVLSRLVQEGVAAHERASAVLHEVARGRRRGEQPAQQTSASARRRRDREAVVARLELEEAVDVLQTAVRWHHLVLGVEWTSLSAPELLAPLHHEAADIYGRIYGLGLGWVLRSMTRAGGAGRTFFRAELLAAEVSVLERRIERDLEHQSRASSDRPLLAAALRYVRALMAATNAFAGAARSARDSPRGARSRPSDVEGAVIAWRAAEGEWASFSSTWLSPT